MKLPKYITNYFDVIKLENEAWDYLFTPNSTDYYGWYDITKQFRKVLKRLKAERILVDFLRTHGQNTSNRFFEITSKISLVVQNDYYKLNTIKIISAKHFIKSLENGHTNYSISNFEIEQIRNFVKENSYGKKEN